MRNADEIRSLYTRPEAVEHYLDQRFASPAGRFHNLSEQRLVQGYLSTARQVTEIACGPGRFGTLAQRLRWHYLGVDVSSPMLHQARERWPDLIFVQADGFILPLADASMDAVLTLRFLRHLTYPERQRVYEECSRILCPGGWLVFDACNEVRHRHLKHQRDVYDALYTASQLHQELERQNFRVRRLSGYLYHDTFIRYLMGMARRFWAWNLILPLHWVYELRYRYERRLSRDKPTDAYLWLVLCQKNAS